MTRSQLHSTVARLALGAVALAVALVVAAPRAEARVERTTNYSWEQVWPTAIRFLRVDAGFEIVEKDGDAGYVLFSVTEERKSFRGALELVRVKDERGRPVIRLVLRIDDRPTYMEAGVLDRLERKLRDEHGEEPPPPEVKPSEKKPSEKKDR